MHSVYFFFFKQKTAYEMLRSLVGSENVYKRQGQYMGQNHGRIISVTDQSIALTEIVPDGLGNYIERSSAVTLME
mgnify:CR=1 FL=1